MAEMSRVREEIGQRSRSTQSLFHGHIARKLAEIEQLRRQEYAMQIDLARAVARNQACERRGSMAEVAEDRRKYADQRQGSRGVQQNENRASLRWVSRLTERGFVRLTRTAVRC